MSFWALKRRAAAARPWLVALAATPIRALGRLRRPQVVELRRAYQRAYQ